MTTNDQQWNKAKLNLALATAQMYADECKQLRNQLDRAHEHLRKVRQQCIDAKHPVAVGKVCASCIITDHLINNNDGNDDDD